MRKTKDVTIIDGGTELKFRLTQLSALGLQRWCIDAGVALAESGLLDMDVGEVMAGGASIDNVFKAIMKNGLGFLGRLDSEKVNDLIVRIVCDCATRISGQASIRVTPAELDATFSDMKALFELEKEVLAINFSFFNIAAPSAGQASEARAPQQSRSKISLGASRR